MKIPIPQIEKLSVDSISLYEVLNKESDLACVLISTSYLDHTLASVLNRYFIERNVVSKLLSPPGGALSGFASRADAVYCLGLIPKGIFQNLQAFGTIRNAFAHNYLHMKFEHPEILKLIARFTFPKPQEAITLEEGIVIENDLEKVFSVFNRPRDKFNIIAVLMVNHLLLLGLNTKHLERKTEGWD